MQTPTNSMKTSKTLHTKLLTFLNPPLDQCSPPASYINPSYIRHLFQIVLCIIIMDQISPSTLPKQVENCRNVLFVYSDGSIVRSAQPSFNATVHDDGSVLYKDVEFDTNHHLSLRLYKPSATTAVSGKLPVFFYFHGGGYCIGSRTWPNCQNYCLNLARSLPAVIVAPDYRLAPENRLPASIEDSVAAVEWLKGQAVGEEPDEWLVGVADFRRVFISGDSAGGNIAHHLAVRLGIGSPGLEPVMVRGYVFLAPFFGGTTRTRSESECAKDAFFPLELNDRHATNFFYKFPRFFIFGC